jgi:hypothetical protein
VGGTAVGSTDATVGKDVAVGSGVEVGASILVGGTSGADVAVGAWVASGRAFSSLNRSKPATMIPIAKSTRIAHPAISHILTPCPPNEPGSLDIAILLVIFRPPVYTSPGKKSTTIET